MKNNPGRKERRDLIHKEGKKKGDLCRASTHKGKSNGLKAKTILAAYENRVRAAKD